MRSRFLTFLIVFQSLQFLEHWFLYATCTSFWGPLDPPALMRLQATTAVLSISFVAASLLAFRYSNAPVRLFYTLAAAWLGTASYSFLAAGACWLSLAAIRLAGFRWERRPIAMALFGLAFALSLYGIINATWTRVHRVTVKLPNLPEQWRGRVAALASDTHLGHVRNYGFMRRIARTIARQRPDVVFIPGDVYDGTRCDADRLAEPWSQLSPPFGAYFVTGNHEEFFSRAKYIAAMQRGGVRVLNNEMVTVEGLQIVGVHYGESVDPERFRAILQGAHLDRSRASVLLSHAPHHLTVAEQEGISLQVSGHTHGGQFFPYTLVASRVYGRFVHGLQQLGNLAVYTNWGAGTWGPPMRVGTKPEIVLIRFE